MANADKFRQKQVDSLSVAQASSQLMDVYTVSRKLTPSQAKKREDTRRRNIAAWKASIDRAKKRAGNIPVVRRFTGMGPCIQAGLLVRETEKYIFYADGCFDASKIESATVKRFKKDGIKMPHVEPCHGCKDHPTREATF